jgi:hypothetical protein
MSGTWGAHSRLVSPLAHDGRMQLAWFVTGTKEHEMRGNQPGMYHIETGLQEFDP